MCTKLIQLVGFFKILLLGALGYLADAYQYIISGFCLLAR
jgi:hypothetical protein